MARWGAGLAVVVTGVVALAHWSTPVGASEAPLFTLHAADLQGPVFVTAGQGVWREATIRNETDDERITVALAGAGLHGDWLQPAVAQVEVEPGEEQAVRWSINPPDDAGGEVELTLRASLAGTGEVAAHNVEIVFSIHVSPSGAASAVSSATPRAAGGAGAISGSNTDGAQTPTARVAVLIALAGVAAITAHIVRRGRHGAPSRRARIEVVALDAERLNRALTQHRAGG